MSNTHDGGPAFPWPPGILTNGYAGMSLRDWFAAHANESDVEYWMTRAGTLSREDARYLYADAMLRARSAQSPAEKMREHLDEFGK